MSGTTSTAEPISARGDDHTDENDDHSTIESSFEGEAGAEFHRSSNTSRRALQVVAPPNTPFNSLSVKQMANMMIKVGISSDGKGNANNDASSIQSRPTLGRNRSSVKCIFDNDVKERGVVGEKDASTSSDESLVHDDDDKGSYNRDRRSSLCMAAKAPPNSPLSMKMEGGSAKMVNGVESHSDIICQSKIREIQLQLRFPHHHDHQEPGSQDGKDQR